MMSRWLGKKRSCSNPITTFFASSSIIEDDDLALGRDFLVGLPTRTDRTHMDNLSDASLRAAYSSCLAKEAIEKTWGEKYRHLLQDHGNLKIEVEKLCSQLRELFGRHEVLVANHKKLND